MKKERLLIVFFVIACCSIFELKAQLQLPAIFTDGMVLQQKSKVNVWGWGPINKKLAVTASWSKQDTIYTVVDNQGRWKVEMETISAGGPYEIYVKVADEEIKIKDVMLGEVWLCCGQSNMEWSANSGIINGEFEIANSDCYNLRIFHQPKQGADFPQSDIRSHWEVSSPQIMRRTSAIAYFFARCLTENLQVPVGIIVAAWGGSPAEVWTPAEIIKNDSILSSYSRGHNPWYPKEAGVVYNQMIHPILQYRIAGCIWYQGESNVGFASSYCRLTTKMLTSWRERFGYEFPFYFVQIAPHTYRSEKDVPPVLREQQEMMQKNMPNCGMINISDLVDNVKDVHPRNKRPVGERLAYMAMDKHYAKFIKPYESPGLKQALLIKDNIIIGLSGDYDKLLSVTKNIVGFNVSDGDGRIYPAKAKIVGKNISVSVKGIKPPYQIFYCFDNATIGSLRTESGIPVLPFRTDLIER